MVGPGSPWIPWWTVPARLRAKSGACLDRRPAARLTPHPTTSSLLVVMEAHILRRRCRPHPMHLAFGMGRRRRVVCRCQLAAIRSRRNLPTPPVTPTPHTLPLRAFSQVLSVRIIPCHGAMRLPMALQMPTCVDERGIPQRIRPRLVLRPAASIATRPLTRSLHP